MNWIWARYCRYHVKLNTQLNAQKQGIFGQFLFDGLFWNWTIAYDKCIQERIQEKGIKMTFVNKGDNRG